MLTVSIISSFIYFIIIFYLFSGYLKNSKKVNNQKYKVSIVISAHNEGENISFCLDDLLKQKYDKDLIEIIIVDDRSEDNTGEILNRYASKYNTIKVITIDSSNSILSPKKYALSKAIDDSTGDIILLTDADCRLNELWISSMVSCFTPNVGAVAGLVFLNPTKWKFSYLMVIDAIINNLIIQGTIGWNFPVACKGGNFAYRRSVYNEVNGFKGLEKSLSGDDDLFIQKISSTTKWKIRSCNIESSFVETYAPSNIQHFFNQRRRHISASKHFSKKVQLAYSIYFFSKFFIFISFLYILYHNGFNSPIIKIIFILYFLTLLILFYVQKNKIKINYLPMYPLWELYYIINHIIIGPFALFGKVKWGKR